MIPLRRAKPLRARARSRIGQASRRRIRAGGPLALGRPSATRDSWRELRAQVLARARWVCQACGVRTRLEVHHVVKRAQGGSDFDLDHLVALCRPCHAQTDAPYARGRLVITPTGRGCFTVAVVRAPSKWAMRQPAEHGAERAVDPIRPPTAPARGPAAGPEGVGWSLRPLAKEIRGDQP